MFLWLTRLINKMLYEALCKTTIKILNDAIYWTDNRGEGYLAWGAIKPLAVSRYEWQCVNGSDRCRPSRALDSGIRPAHLFVTPPRWVYPSKTERYGNKYQWVTNTLNSSKNYIYLFSCFEMNHKYNRYLGVLWSDFTWTLKGIWR